MVTPNKISLITRGRYDEYVAAADCYPGMHLTLNSTGGCLPNNVPGGAPAPFIVCEENALAGGDTTQKNPSGSVTPVRKPAKGDVMLMLLQYGQNVAQNVGLVSAGDGTLIANPGQGGSLLYEITTPSTVITNVGTETAFSNGSYTIPANFLQVGDVLHIRAKAFLIAENSTNTHRVRLYFGATPTTIADSTAIQMAANDYVIIDAYITIRTITASGTFIADGFVEYTISGTATTAPFTIASTTVDSTVSETIVVKSLASATSTGNQIRLDEFRIDLIRASGLTSIVTTAEAINNSAGAGSSPVSNFTSAGGAAAFIRVNVP